MTDKHDESWEVLVASVQKAGKEFSRSQSRNKWRAYFLGHLLSKSAEPNSAYVLATSDGRTLDVFPGNRRGLDLGDRPHHWSREAASLESERWNRDNLPQDHVFPIYWRDFYAAQILRIQSRCG